MQLNLGAIFLALLGVMATLAIDAMAILSCCYLALGLSYKFGGPTSVRLNVWPAVCEI